MKDLKNDKIRHNLYITINMFNQAILPNITSVEYVKTIMPTKYYWKITTRNASHIYYIEDGYYPELDKILLPYLRHEN